ncbi:MAG: carboxypeptidase regulatory-like domain-containing protein [Chloroflexi bacterium]|nr:carboxypeptidase regulatory-like domain-containing protein [Chloroflexota bacterium]MBV9892924.1 carboxypeptidase regulatory-like domain-containing protein [Chloroflexota bacterium]
MFVVRSYRAGGAAIALGLSLTLFGVAYAQQGQQAQPAGVVLGEVDRCNGANETPAPGVSVGIDGGPAKLATTDSNGQFALNVAAGTYTVIASADDGSTTSRQYVPVEGGVTIDIGILDLGGGVGGCGGLDSGPPPAPAPAAVQPTLTPTAAPTLPPPTATPVPPPPPTPTPEVTPEPAATDTGG